MKKRIHIYVNKTNRPNIPVSSYIAIRAPRWNSTIRFRRCRTVSIVRSTRTVMSLVRYKNQSRELASRGHSAGVMPPQDEPHSRSFVNSSSLADLRGASTLRPPTLAAASRSGWPSTWNCRGCSAGKARVPLASESAPPRRGTNRRRGMKIGGERKREREKERRDAFSRCALGRRGRRVLSRWTSGNLVLIIPRWSTQLARPRCCTFAG